MLQPTIEYVLYDQTNRILHYKTKLTNKYLILWHQSECNWEIEYRKPSLLAEVTFVQYLAKSKSKILWESGVRKNQRRR